MLGKQGSCLSGEKCLPFRVEIHKRYGSYVQDFTVLRMTPRCCMS